MKKNNKATQINFGETIGILIVLYFVIFFGIVFYNSYERGQIEDIKKQELFDSSVLKYEFLTNLELLKESENGIIKDRFNYINLLAFSKISQNKTSLVFKFLENKFQKAQIEILLYDNSNENFENITIYKNVPKTFSNKFNYIGVVVVYDSVEKKTYLGKILMSYYY